MKIKRIEMPGRMTRFNEWLPRSEPCWIPFSRVDAPSATDEAKNALAVILINSFRVASACTSVRTVPLVT